jgi:glycosyltransferase involved in cell wall biosynthesis
MKVLLCHCYYQQRGGEDESFDAEARLLEEQGHEVVRFTRQNDAVYGMGRWQLLRDTFWSRSVFRDVRALIRRVQPEVMHCTNTFPLISPAAYRAAQAEGVPVVQALRNYRLLCPGALFLRNGRVCEDCLGKRLAWPGVRHACYRKSRGGSAVVAALVGAHHVLGTWARAVTLFFTPSAFARQKFLQAGFPAAHIAVKPNFVAPDPGVGPGTGGYAVFVGRLAPEKGITTLLAAWARLRGRLNLKVIGDGPLSGQVREAIRPGSGIEWLGRRPLAEVLHLLGDAAFLVMPSVWYETFGRTIIEAFARGTPVIASRLGAMAELVDDGRTGLLVEAGDPIDLEAKVRQLLDDSQALARMRREARAVYERQYTAEVNHHLLLDLYTRALALNGARQPTRTTNPVPLLESHSS